MKAIIATLLLTLFSSQLTAKSRGMSLEEAVNQVKSEGQVLSAKTVNGKHEIKVLTPSGAVKTISKKAATSQAQTKPKRPEYYNKGGQSFRDRKQNNAIPNRFDNQQRDRRRGSRQLDLQPMTFQNRSKSNNTKKNNRSNNNNKEK